MKLDLKETKTSEAESFNHLCTLLMCMYSEIERLKDNNNDKETEKQWNKRIKREKEIYKEAQTYLKTYIEELIKQKL